MPVEEALFALAYIKCQITTFFRLNRRQHATNSLLGTIGRFDGNSLIHDSACRRKAGSRLELALSRPDHLIGRCWVLARNGHRLHNARGHSALQLLHLTRYPERAWPSGYTGPRREARDPMAARRRNPASI